LQFGNWALHGAVTGGGDWKSLEYGNAGFPKVASAVATGDG
jgi:hypothetical protein